MEREQKNMRLPDELTEGAYCLMQHFATFFKQSAYDEKADFGEPCEKCERVTNCDLKWLEKIVPFCEETGVYVNVGFPALPERPGSDRHYPG